MKIKISKGNCLDYQGEVIILFHFSGIRPLTGSPALLDWRCNASVSALLKRKPDLFRFGQLTIVATQGKIPTETVILTGLGARDALDRDMGREACRLALKAALKVGLREVAVDLSSLSIHQERITVDDLKSLLVDIDKQDTLRISVYPGDNRQQPPSGRKSDRQMELSEP